VHVIKMLLLPICGLRRRGRYAQRCKLASALISGGEGVVELMGAYKRLMLPSYVQPLVR